MILTAAMFCAAPPGTVRADEPGTLAAQVQAAETTEDNEYTSGDVEGMIDALPDVSSITDSDRTAVKTAGEAYDGLSDADKVHVTNAAKLQELRNVFSIKDAQKNSGSGNGDTAAEGITAAETAPAANTQFEFSIDDLTKSVSIIIHYEYDTDGDGVNDTPDVSLISPKGEEIKLQEGYPQVERDALTAQAAWSDNQMEIDIEKAQSGTWKVNSSIPVVFEKSTYKAPAASITPSVEEGKNKTKKSSRLKSIVWIICSAAAIIFLLLFAKKHDEKAAKEKINANTPEKKDEEDSLMDIIANEAAENGIEFKLKPVVGEIKKETVGTIQADMPDEADNSVTGEDTTDFRLLQEKFNLAAESGESMPAMRNTTIEDTGLSVDMTTYAGPEAENESSTGGKDEMETGGSGAGSPDLTPAAHDVSGSKPGRSKKLKKQFRKRSF